MEARAGLLRCASVRRSEAMGLQGGKEERMVCVRIDILSLRGAPAFC